MGYSLISPIPQPWEQDGHLYQAIVAGSPNNRSRYIPKLDACWRVPSDDEEVEEFANLLAMIPKKKPESAK